jgi:hypothetical protein
VGDAASEGGQAGNGCGALEWGKRLRYKEENSTLANVATKQQILEGAGYRYSFDREVYFNRQAKKAFSVDFVEDKPEEELKRHIEETPAKDWQFFFNNPPSDAVKRELTNVLS